MTIQVKILSLVNALGRTVLNNGLRYNFPAIQQTAYLKQSVDAKLNLPPKPKRPLSAYFKYMLDVRPKVKQELPNASAVEIVREVASRWEKVGTQVKEKLDAEYRKQLEVYTKEKLEYDTKLTEEQKDAIKKARDEKVAEKEKRRHRKKCRENKKPKKPASPFVYYMKSQLPKRGSQPINEWRKQVSSQWHLLSDEEKKPYFQQVHDGMREYQKKMVEWERKMIQMGNTDLVRHDALIEVKPKKITKPKTHKIE